MATRGAGDLSTPASLLERVRDLADAASWGRFVDLYTPLVLLWLRKFGLGVEDRADAAQCVFAQLVKELPAFVYDPSLRFRGYLFAVTRSRANDLLRARKRTPVAELTTDPAGLDPAAAADDAEYARYLVHRAARVLASDFDEATREAFRRYALGGEDARQVAAALGVAVATVYQAKSRVTRRLREELAGLLD